MRKRQVGRADFLGFFEGVFEGFVFKNIFEDTYQGFFFFDGFLFWGDFGILLEGCDFFRVG